MQPFSKQRGAVMVWTVVSLLMLIGIIGLALDWGYVYWTGQQLQNAADAAALAGAQVVHDNPVQARSAAIALAGANYAGGRFVGLRDNATNDPTGDVVCGTYNRATRTFTPTLQSPLNAVRAVARRSEGSLIGALPLFFGPIFGKPTADVTRFAIAMSEEGPVDNSIIALNPNAPDAFYLKGSPTVDVGDSAIQVNSNNSSAAHLQGGTNVILNADQLNIVGQLVTSANVNNSATVNTGVATLLDPLASLPAPTIPKAGTPTAITASGTYYAGYYPGGLNINSTTTVRLLPNPTTGSDVFVFGNGVSINGSAHLSADGVMLYLASGSINKSNGNNVTTLTPPSSGTYQGVSIFQARGNTTGTTFTGNGTINTTGIFYLPAAKFTVTGNGKVGTQSLGQLIANTIEISGNGSLKVQGTTNNDAGGRKVYLVE